MIDQKVAIFWDYENCPAPTGCSGFQLVKSIRSLIQPFGSIKSFKAYLSVSEQTQLPKTVLLRSELQASGVSLTDTPHNGRKDVADKMIIVDMLAHALDNPAPTTVVLISGDRDFAYAIAVLRLRQYHVVLITLPNAHASLTSHASVSFDWNKHILPGVDARPVSPPDEFNLLPKNGKPAVGVANAAMPQVASKFPNSGPNICESNENKVERNIPFVPTKYEDVEPQKALKTLPANEGYSRRLSRFDSFSSNGSFATCYSSQAGETVQARPAPVSEFNPNAQLTNGICTTQIHRTPRLPSFLQSSVSSSSETSSFTTPSVSPLPPTPFPAVSRGAALNNRDTVPIPEARGMQSAVDQLANTLLAADYSHTPPPPDYSQSPRLSQTSSAPLFGLGTHRAPDQVVKPVPPHFKPLVQILQAYHQRGISRPFRPAIAVEVYTADKAVYEALPIGTDRTFTAYAELAEREGFAEIGGSGGNGWIALSPQYFSVSLDS